MPIEMFKLTVTSTQAAKRLDDVLIGWLSEALRRPVSKAKARKLVVAGVVRLDGRPARIPSVILSSGARIEAAVDAAKLFSDSPSRDRSFDLTPDRILFEDEDLIVIDKPAGLPSHPTADESRDNLFAAVGRFLSRRDGKREAYLGIHQRLDRDTSGVFLFTKSRRVNAAIGDLFTHHRITKVYEAIAAPRSKGGKSERRWTVKNRLDRIPGPSKRARYGAVRSGGEVAETVFRVLAESPRSLRIEAAPRTGRTHQIRVHLAECGLPILGDDLYGSASSAPRLMLHARRLTFIHPITKLEVLVVSPLPADFERVLNSLH